MVGIHGCNPISLTVVAGTFTSCQLFLLYLAAPFLTAFGLFLFGIAIYIYTFYYTKLKANFINELYTFV